MNPVIVNRLAHYNEVNLLVQELIQSVQIILGSHFVGAYLFGSLTSGDFDQHSDIDVLVVADDQLSYDLFAALKTMQSRISARDSWWATQLEVSYIPRQALRRHNPASAMHPHIDRGRVRFFT